MDKKFDVTGMTCSACSSHVEKSVCKLVGEGNVSVSLLTNSMQVSYDESKISENDIIKAVEDAGYGASVAGGSSAKKAEKKESVVDAELKEMKTRLIVSFVFLIPLMYVVNGRTSAVRIPCGPQQCRVLCLYPVFDVPADSLCEQKIFSGRI